MRRKSIVICSIAMGLVSSPSLAQTNAQQPETEQTTVEAQERPTATVDDISDYGWLGIVGLLGLAGLMRRRSIVMPARETPTDESRPVRRDRQ